ncbi:MAG: dihydrolipoyl dehydrogenase, partial [Bacilli bacterium]|nr:dihydrolipoyl dehydrogenase [Bacilli bacterium]
MNDLIIIGAGPGGYELALEASKKGLSTILIERERLGGVCLREGCIPTKTWYKSAELLRDIKEAQALGLECLSPTFDFSVAQARKDGIVKGLEEGIRFSLEKAKVELVSGEGTLQGPHQVRVNETVYEAKTIVIATGSRPMMIPGFEVAWDSTQILASTTLPKKLIVIGGGVIGLEMACIMQAMGVAVTIVEFMDRILPTADREISKRLQTYLKAQGILPIVGAMAKEMVEGGIHIEAKGKLQFIEGDQVLVAVGRRPNIEGLGLEKLGIVHDRKGIKVNQNFETNVPGIYAIGDVTGKMMLAHVATYQGYHVLHHLQDEASHIRFDLVPSCVFSFPEVAWVGVTEEECTPGSYTTYKSLYRANGKAHAMNAVDGFVKMIVRDDHIIGV